jgi:hypothetical protein
MSNDLDEVKEIIKTSGNTFHCNVLEYFQKKGWAVLISPYYNDNISSKPREIDLIAEKAFQAKDQCDSFFGTVNIKLFIECKYISQKTVFWFHDKDKEQAENLVVKNTPLRKDNAYTQQHHYLCTPDKVAKLFADKRQKSADNEVFYKALNQSLNAMVYYRNRESIIKTKSSRHYPPLRLVNYPIIVCNSFDKLYRIDIGLNDEPKKISDNFQLEVNYAYLTSTGSNINEYFLIDLIDFNQLDNFLESLENDSKLVSCFLEKN